MAITRDILKEVLKSQYDFHFDETKRLLELARKVPEERFTAKNQYSSGGIQATFAHLLGSDRFWRGVLTESSGTAEDTFDETSVDGLIVWNNSERAAWSKYIEGLDDRRLMARVERDLPFGAFSFTPGQAMQHVILHGHQHHTEIAQLLTEAGYSPGDVDYFDFIAVRRSS